jgi:hypothetical protein
MALHKLAELSEITETMENIHCLSVFPISVTMLATVIVLSFTTVFWLKLCFFLVDNLEAIVNEFSNLLTVKLALNLLLTR